MRHWKVLGLAALALALLAGPARAQTTLRYKFKEGDKLPYTAVTDMLSTASFGGMDIESKFKMSAEAELSVTKVEPDGSARVRLKMGRVKISLEAPTANGEFDSANKNDGDGEGIGALLGKVGRRLADLDVTFTLTPDGQTRDVSLPKPKKMKGGGGAGMEKMFLDLFSPEVLVEGFSLLQLPKDPVSKGDKWEDKKTVGSPVGKVTVSNKYVYEGQVEKGGKKLEKIAVTPQIKVAGAGDAKLPFKVKIKSSKGKGAAYFDNQAGRLLETTNEMVMDAEISLGEIMLPSRVTQTATLRLKRAKSK
jgi:hypothetical protein